MSAKEALLKIKPIIEELGDERARGSYYLEFGRRTYVLKLVTKYCSKGAKVIDLGAQPFILSCALAELGYDVTAVDIEPEPYMKIAEKCNIKVVKADLEKDESNIENADCAVFTEVIEHINPYYVPTALININKMLKTNGKLILTTPNIASLFRRIKLLLGKSPIYQLHVREYTKDEIERLLSEAGFEIIESKYSEINDLTFIHADKEEYLKINNYIDLIKITMRKPTKTNMARAIAYPLVKAIPTLRMLITIVAEKHTTPRQKTIQRW